jgi:hypothetical protein
MKFRNNLSDEAFRNLYREQGYNEKQITELMDGLLYGIDIDEYINPSIEAKHIEMLMQFAREEEDLDRYFLPDGSLDDVGLEHDYKSHCENIFGVDVFCHGGI